MRDGRYAGDFAPRQKFRHGAAVGAPRVRVADVCGEEFEEARARPVAGRGDQDGNRKGRGREVGELVHEQTPRVVTGKSANPAAIEA
jgi:hypothetical protein